MPEPHGRYTLIKVTLERKGEVGPGVSMRRWMKPWTTISSEMSKEEAKRRLMRMSVPARWEEDGIGFTAGAISTYMFYKTQTYHQGLCV